jgi:hypothetical protein
MGWGRNADPGKVQASMIVIGTVLLDGTAMRGRCG